MSNNKSRNIREGSRKGGLSPRPTTPRPDITPVPQKLSYFKVKKSKWLRVSQKIYMKLLQDADDMHNSRCTSFDRCSNCGHLHDSNLICGNCEVDDSHSL